MDSLRFMKLLFIFLTSVLLSYQMVPDDDVTDFVCPLVDIFYNNTEGVIVHYVNRSESCKNGRGMAGCCVDRFYCEFNSTNIDLSLYGPRGFRMPCKEVCCPERYILPIPLWNETINDNDSAKSSDDNGSDNSDDSDDDDDDDDEDDDEDDTLIQK